jgi:radical SAM superfamily enzyme YgiQ (UPF0313 family)
MKALLIYPKYPDPFWSFKYALKFVSKKASLPPLGLLTVAAMLPNEWEKRLVDLNVSALTQEDLEWADTIFISAMVVQKNSALEVIRRGKNLGKTIIVGGPLFTTAYGDFKDIDHFVLNEAEGTLPSFLDDMKNEKTQHLYTTKDWPDIGKTPPPQWELIHMKKYESMCIQYSRGCPFNCEFCDIIVLNGRKPRTKNKDQILNELELLFARGWKGSVFFVDDNFIGNKKRLKTELLPFLIQWMDQKKHPFSFYTEASINLADDEDLMGLMVRAGFNRVFIGIETPNEDSLTECNKHLNKNRDMIACVKKIQSKGIEVMGGFIVGFDNDNSSIFQRQINFIQKSGIVTAMVGLLNAPRGTTLYKRLKKENRLLKDSSGDNTDFTLNFIPKMKIETLITGYKEIIGTIYSPKNYYERVITFLKEYHPPKIKLHFKFSHLKAFLKSIWFLGITGKERLQYWKLVSWTLVRRPRFFSLAITLAIYGFHFRKIAGV